MPRKRSRANTEEKFLNAVLELVADEGCSALGINAAAHKAGADKVLIYRYFTNLDGLLQRVADSRQWLPTIDELTDTLSIEESAPAAGVMHQLARQLTQHIRADEATHQILRWRKAETNPLTEHFSNQWQALWQQLAEFLSTGLDYDTRELWKHATALTALTVEADLCDEPLSYNCIDHITKDIVLGRVPSSDKLSEPSIEDQLPTNLL